MLHAARASATTLCSGRWSQVDSPFIRTLALVSLQQTGRREVFGMARVARADLFDPAQVSVFHWGGQGKPSI
jgi:hypothetical protein